MRSIAVSVFAILSLLVAVDAQISKAEGELVALEKASWEAWQKRDGKYFESFLSVDHVEVGQSGIAGKSQIVAFVGNPVCKVNSYKVDRFKLTLFEKNTALLTYYAEQDTVCGSVTVPSPAWASSLYIKRDGKWLNALYQQTPITK